MYSLILRTAAWLMLPVLMLFSLALGARLFGVIGMVAAVPFAAAVQVALGQYYPQIFDDLRKPAHRHRDRAADPPADSSSRSE